MPRKVRDERLDTRAARLKLKPRPEPYWRNIQEGRAIGYRRLASGKSGSWIARHYDRRDGRRYEALAVADDMLEADGATTLSFGQAQDSARDWFQKIERESGRVVEPLTLRRVLDLYEADYTARGGKALADLRRVIAAHILPALGDRLVSDLTFSTIRSWHQGLAAAPARLRTKPGAEIANTRAAHTTDAQRARRATANRVLTVLKAALSLAYREGKVPTDDAWRRVRPFPKVDAARTRYLTDPEAVRLVNAAPSDLYALVVAALLTGCRYGELAALHVGDFDSTAAVLHVRDAKAGKARTVHLTNDAMEFFPGKAAGKPAFELLLTRTDGTPWGKSHQSRPLGEACVAAQIVPAISFHILRHTFASRMARKRVPMAVIAEALGNTEAICAKHYAHLAPGYVADTIREHAGGMGIVPNTKSSS